MRQIIRQIQSGSYAAGQVNVLIPRVGYLARLWLRFNGTLNNSGTAAGTAGDRAPWSLIKSARLNVNGNVFPLAADGYSYEILARTMRPGYADDSQFGVAAGNNAVVFALNFPVTVTDSQLVGTIWTGNPETTTYLELTFAAANDPTFATPPSGATLTLTGQWEVWGEFFLFNANEAKPDVSTLHQVTVLTQNVTSTGPQTINLPTLDEIYLRIIHVMENGGTLLGYTEGMEFQYKIETYEDPYTLTDGEFDHLQNYRYLGKLGLSTGARVLDLYWTRTLRDVINARGLSLFQAKITIPSSVTITQPANVYTIVETLAPLH
jgi:hypothetical protein